MTMSAGTAIVIAAVLTLSGCAFITVKKLSPNSDTAAVKGQRFALPKPYIHIAQQADGSLEANIVYLPDPEHTYAIDSSSYFATDTLEVNTKDGIVTMIDWTGDSSAVVAEAIKSAGVVASSVLETKEKQKIEQNAKEDAAIKSVDDAQLEFDQAVSRQEILLNTQPSNQEAILEAQIAVAAANLKLTAAKAALDRMRGVALSTNDEAASKAFEDAESELEKARTDLVTLRANKSVLQDDLQKAQLAVDAAALKVQRLQRTLAREFGYRFGPKLFAIHEEIQESADRKTRYPFLKIVTVEQRPDQPESGWNPSQPMYPVWPQAPP